MTPRLRALGWNPSYRLVPSRFPPVSLFDRVATAEQLDAVFAVQALTNPRLRQEAGEISLVAPAERVAGPGSTPVMAAFCHLNPAGSRFSDGSWGVYYAAAAIEVAAAEVGYHQGRFLAATAQAALEVDLRCYVAAIAPPLHDLRPARWAPVHAPDDYAPSQALARTLRAAGSHGVAYRSVRHAGGECVALFRPRALILPVVQGAHVTLRWDGSAMVGWYTKSALTALGAAGG